MSESSLPPRKSHLQTILILGTAFTLASIGELGSISDETNIVFEGKAGLVPITIRKTDDDI